MHSALLPALNESPLEPNQAVDLGVPDSALSPLYFSVLASHADFFAVPNLGLAFLFFFLSSYLPFSARVTSSYIVGTLSRLTRTLPELHLRHSFVFVKC